MIVLLLAAAGLIVAAIRIRPVVVKVVSGLLAITLAAGGGIAVVNDYYGYYETWSQLSADLSGTYASYGSTTTVSRHAGPIAQGTVRKVMLPGARSGIDRPGLVYLPPQYDQAAYANTTFPVIELLHGTPGSPSNWTVNLGLTTTLNRLISLHLMGPVIAVMPTTSVGQKFQECVDVQGALDDTYVTEDVRADVLAKYRASPLPAEWGIGGYSSGGYCAANLALRHQARFGAAGIMDGYFRPTDGPAAAALHFNPAAEAANDPLLAARRLMPGAGPLPSFWVSAGTGDAADMAAARAFGVALHGVEQVTLYSEPGAAHNFDAWRPAIPPMLQWMWTQLAPPTLRVQFPITGMVRDSVILAPGASRRSARHRHEARVRSAAHHRSPAPSRSRSSAPAAVSTVRSNT